MSNPWLIVAGLAAVLAALGWMFSFVVRDLGWPEALKVLAFAVGMTAVIAGGITLAVYGARGGL